MPQVNPRRVKLNDAAVKAIQRPASGQVAYWDVTLPGFGLRVAPGGAKTWIVMYRHGGSVRRLKLGRYPLMSLANARDKAKEVLAAVVRGDDPVGDKRAERDAATFGEVAREYLERQRAAEEAVMEGRSARARSRRTSGVAHTEGEGHHGSGCA